MKVVVLGSALLIIVACTSHHREEASKCGATEAQMSQAVDEVSRMEPYAGKRVGRCELIVDDGRAVSIITPEIQRSVDNMIALENAESNR